MKFARVKLASMMTVLVLAAGSAVWADAPSTRPAQAQQQTQKQGRVSPSPMRRAILRLLSGGIGKNPNVRPATQQEWDEMMDFLRDASPSRYSVLSTLKPPLSSPVSLDAIRKWRNYNFTREHLPDVATQMVQRFHLEDDLFAITLAAQENPDDIDEFHDKIHDKVASLVQLDFTERQVRIDKLQKLLEEEKSKLAQDESTQDKTIDQRTNAILNRLEKLKHTYASAPSTRPDSQDDASDSQNPPVAHDAMINVSNGSDTPTK